MNLYRNSPALIRWSCKRGFALVVTLSLMILLVIVAVGLLTLSSVSLRATSQSLMMGQARANARLAMMIAIGEVQKSLGPDRSAAAPASMVLDSPAEPHVAGVWESWTWDPTMMDSAPDYASKKQSRFRGWLMSDSQEPGKRMDLSFPSTQPGNAIPLVGTGSATPLGTEKTGVSAGVTELDSGQNLAEAFAWVALQEDVKAHVQPGAGDQPTEDEAGYATRFAPDESGLKTLSAMGELVDDRGARQRSLSTSTISLAANDPSVGSRSFHHLSPYPMGVLADAAAGGLRRDLTTEFENFSTSTLKGKRLYDAGTGAAPWWDALADYYQLAERVKGEGGGGSKPINIDADLTRFSEIRGSNTAPQRAVLTPVVAKVDIVFSMVTHDLRSQYQAKYKKADPRNRYYSPWLVFEPIVTLWNPYNVPIEFSELKLYFDKIPVGFRFQKRDGRGSWVDVRNTSNDTTEYWWPLSRFIWGGGKVDAISEFFIRLQGGSADTRLGGGITLEPGETRVFTAWVGASQTWGQVKNQFMITTSGDAKSKIQAGGSGVKYAGGWNRTGGYRFDHLARYLEHRNPASVNSAEKTMNNRGDWHWVALRANDGFRVRARLLDNDKPDTDNDADNDVDRSFDMNLALMSKDAQNLSDTRNIVQNMKISVKDFHNLYQKDEPKIIEHDIVADEVYQADSSKGPAGKSSFAVLSLTAKPTRDLLHPTKGWLFGNPVTANLEVDENLAPYSAQSHEISFLEVFGSNGFPMVDVDIATGTRGFFGPGQTSEYGLTSAPMFALPREPMISIGQFESANLLASGALPHFNYPVGNSHAHPLIPADKVKVDRLLDHSYAMNWSLWDAFYFSSLSEDAPVNATAFADGEVPMNSRMSYYSGGAASNTDAVDRMTGGDPSTRSRRVASHQMLKGPFNVNSTSVDAWKAVLAGLRDRAVITRDGGERAIDDETAFGRLHGASTPEDEAAAIGGGAGTGGLEAARAERWVGIHRLSDSQITMLAEEIVEQIKLRGQADEGPILTLGEFVNRRPGPANDIHAVKGLLQTAIEEANEKAGIYSLEDGDPVAISDPVANSGALEGNTAEGSPADLLQGDILQSIGSFLTTHTDTLRIRSYGRAGEGNNRAEAWCEAIIQRTPEYVDASDAAEDLPTAGSINEIFGRRFQIVSFRWLSRDEI